MPGQPAFYLTNSFVIAKLPILDSWVLVGVAVSSFEEDCEMDGVFRRRNLPHWDVLEQPVFITGCLQGSISQVLAD